MAQRKKKRLPNIDLLPEPLLTEILARLPVKDIYKFRSVCKKWKDLLSSREFWRIHKQLRAAVGFLALSSSIHRTHDFYFFEFARSATNDIETSEIRFRSPFKHYPDNMIVSNTCNGYFCFYKAESWKKFYLCNPIRNEYVPVPHTPRKDYTVCRIILGFDPSSENYKILRFLSRKMLRKTVAEVLVLKAVPTEGDIWRSIDNEDAPSSFIKDYCILHGRFWNGAFHQVDSSGTKETGFNFDSIVCFDFVSDQFKTFPAPSYFDEIDYSSQDEKRKRVIRTSDMTLGVLEDFFCVGLLIPEVPFFKVWAMKIYGVKESWTTLFSIRTNVYCLPLTLFRYGARLLICHSWNVVVTCVKDETQSSTFIEHESTVITNNNPITSMVEVPYSPNYASLKDVAGPYYKKVMMGQRLKTLAKGHKAPR